MCCMCESDVSSPAAWSCFIKLCSMLKLRPVTRSRRMSVQDSLQAAVNPELLFSLV